MGDLTKNLSRSEFQCPCGECEEIAIDYELVTGIQGFIDWLSALTNRPVGVHITSGHRCDAYNLKIGGADKSKHRRGLAADQVYYFKDKAEKVPTTLVYKWWSSKLKKGGIGRYNTFTHTDTSSVRKWRNQ